MTLVYVDTSAWAKHVLTEAESASLADYVAERSAAGDSFIASDLMRVELSRALVRRGLPRNAADVYLDAVTLVGFDQSIRDIACALPMPLRALDAIHLATAMPLADQAEGDEEWVTTFVTYDAQLGEAARSLGLEVVSPGAA